MNSATSCWSVRLQKVTPMTIALSMAGLAVLACSSQRDVQPGSVVIDNSNSEPAAAISSGGNSTTAAVSTTTHVSINPSAAGTSSINGVGGTAGTQGVTEVIVTENCASTSVTATDVTVVKPADIIFAIDSSRSMNEEIEFVQTYMNEFSQQIVDSGIDIRVILLGSPTGTMGMMGQAENGICIGAPLGSGTCPEDTNLPSYVHIATPVGSNDALNVIIDSYTQWSSYLRADAGKFFVVVTDDNATDEPNNTAAAFSTNLAALDPAMFAEWSMNGVYCFTECEQAAAIGAVYVDLVNQTGGVDGDLCLQDFQPVFDRLAAQIIENTGAAIACEWEFPAVPAGQTFSAELIEVQRSGTNGISTIPRVESAAECEALGGGWYYDDVAAPTQIVACPSTCQEIQNDTAGKIDVVFGCEVVEGCAASSLTAENTVMGDSVVCEWELPDAPEGTELDSESVNVRYTNAAGVATQLGKVPSAADCAMFSRGWYYDNDDQPQSVLVCPDVCALIQEGGVNTQVDILLGCTTKPAEIK